MGVSLFIIFSFVLNSHFLLQIPQAFHCNTTYKLLFAFDLIFVAFYYFYVSFLYKSAVY